MTLQQHYPLHPGALIQRTDIESLSEITGNRFTGFQPTNETVLEAALVKLRGHNVVPFHTSLSKH